MEGTARPARRRERAVVDAALRMPAHNIPIQNVAAPMSRRRRTPRHLRAGASHRSRRPGVPPSARAAARVEARGSVSSTPVARSRTRLSDGSTSRERTATMRSIPT